MFLWCWHIVVPIGETKAQRPMLHVLEGVGLQPPCLTHCHTHWVQSKVVASSGRLPSSLSASLWVPSSAWAGGPGDHPLKCLLKVSWTTPGGQINCPWATYITLAYGNFASFKKKCHEKSILCLRPTRLKIAQSASKCVWFFLCAYPHPLTPSSQQMNVLQDTPPVHPPQSDQRDLLKGRSNCFSA